MCLPRTAVRFFRRTIPALAVNHAGTLYLYPMQMRLDNRCITIRETSQICRDFHMAAICHLTGTHRTVIGVTWYYYSQ